MISHPINIQASIVMSNIVLTGDTVNKQPNIANRKKAIQSQQVGYLHNVVEELNSDYREHMQIVVGWRI